MVRLSIIQFTPEWGNKKVNLERIGNLLTGLETDIIVLPEFCTTGYSFLSKEEALNEAEELSRESSALFKKLSLQLNAVIVAGFAEKDGDLTYNSALIALPDGDLKTYRKSHLFYKEKLCFEPGNSGFFVVDHPTKNCRIGVMVCNDWRYPEAARSLALLGADVIACPSNLVSTLWGVAMPARALENKVYLAVANRCGTEIRQLADGSEQTLTFNGGSVIYDYNGSPLMQAGKTEDALITIEIEPALTRDKAFNAYNNLMDDRRPDLYKL
jgi:predicted amidohydrolase